MIDNNLYSNVLPMPGQNPEEPTIEIEIDLGDDSGAEEPDDKEEKKFHRNLAEDLDETERAKLCSELITQFDTDLQSRRDWIQAYFKGLELVGLKTEERTEPWPKACGVYHPLLTEAAVRFQSEVMTETFPAAGPIKTVVVGEETKDNLAAAARVAEDMNYQLTDIMPEYRAEHEKMLWALALAGAAFKKVYYDDVLGRQTAVFVPAEDLVIPYGASGLYNAERITHVMRKAPNDIKKLMSSGFYLDMDVEELQDPLDEIENERLKATGEEFSAVVDTRHRLLEIQVDLDLSEYGDKDEYGFGDGVYTPYIVTINRSTNELYSIYRNYEEEDDNKSRRDHFIQYTYVPGLGAYGYGLIHLIGGYARAATSITRQLVDSGTLSNLPGGFKTRGLRVNRGSPDPIGPGEWVDVDVPGGALRDNLMPLPYKEPSPTLYQLLGDIINEGKSFVNASELNVSEMSGQAPVGTTLALLERQLKVMSAIQARMHYSMKQEFKLLKVIIKECLPDEYDYDVEKADRSVKKQDYDACEVIPVSDPNAATMAHKIIQYQTITQMAQQAPQGTFDVKALYRQTIEAIGMKNADKLVPIDDDVTNTDPVTENQSIMTGKPVKAFQEQDHEAHIAVHSAIMQDPGIQQWLQNNPMAQGIIAQLQQHLAEHYGMKFRSQVEQQMGIPIPQTKDGEDLPPEIERSISTMAAQATQQVLATNQQIAAQKAAMQAAQDPMVQMQQQELQLKAKAVEQKDRELNIKERQLVQDAAHKADQTDLAQQKIDSTEKIAGMQIGAQMAKDKAQMDNSQEAAGLKAGIDIAKTIHQGEVTRESRKDTARTPAKKK